MVPQVMMVAKWQLFQDGESEDSSFTTSSSMSNFKIRSPIRGSGLNEMEEYVCMLEGGAPHASQYNMDQALSYQRLPMLEVQPPSIMKDHYLIKNEEAHSSISTIITKENYYFFNPALHTKALQYPPPLLDFDTHSASIAAPPFIKALKQAYAQSLHHIEYDAQVIPPTITDFSLLHDPSLPPSPPSPFVSDDSYSKHLLHTYEAGDSHVHSLPPQFCNDSLDPSSNGAYMSSYFPSSTFSTSPTLPPIISTNSSPITSLASHTSAIADTASADAAPSMPPLDCKDTHFLSGSEVMPSLMSLHTRSLMHKTSKGIKNVETDKVIKKKRKRTRSRKNSEELESQRMTHIAVERNRRRQMNQHLNDLRSLMPSSYIQRGDQASIVGGAIRLVEELEQVLESLLLQRQIRGGPPNEQVPLSHLDEDKSASIRKDSYACSESSAVNVQVEMISLSSILVKVIAPKRHHQLLDTLQALKFLSLKVLHLNITTLDISILYTFNLKMENDCQFQTPLQLAKSIQHVFETPKTKDSE